MIRSTLLSPKRDPRGTQRTAGRCDLRRQPVVRASALTTVLEILAASSSSCH